MVNGNSLEKTVGGRAQASSVAAKQCERCGAAVGDEDFCPACKEFFRKLSDQSGIHQA